MKLARRAVLPLVLAAGLALAGCSSSSGGGTTAAQPSEAAPSSSAPSPAAAAGGSGPVLTIAGFSYSPKPLTVVPGASVSVTNKDGVDHTATSDTSGAFDSSDVAHGQVVTFKAPTRPGTYTFHCAFHPNMHGTLVVT